MRVAQVVACTRNVDAALQAGTLTSRLFTEHAGDTHNGTEPPPCLQQQSDSCGKTESIQSYLEQQTDDLTCSFKHHQQDPCPGDDRNDHHFITCTRRDMTAMLLFV